jgi:hypothetical protein
VGAPFTTRRKADAGLSFPTVSEWPNFICEACTVRAVLDRELRGVNDWKLLCFERMRLIDMAHSWAVGTHAQYQHKLQALRKFERHFGVSLLRPTPIVAPPKGPEIILMWAQEQYSLRKSPRRGDGGDELTLAFTTVRQLRSAVSQYAQWDLMVAHPGRLYMDPSRRLMIQAGRFTDDASSTMFATGMSSRLGNEARPSVALLDRHVRWLNHDLDLRFRQAISPAIKQELARAALANLLLWLGWLRSSETFSLSWRDLIVVEPSDGPSVDLPPGCGVILLRLQPETKASRDRRSDVVIAYRTLSGYSFGSWFHRLRRLLRFNTDWAHDSRLLFPMGSGEPWTSLYFRETYLYPALTTQRIRGDPLLVPFDGSPGNSIPEKFWSLHCYRRGARSHVSRSRPLQFRKADEAQVYEHGRWRRKRSTEKIDVIYREWTIRDRIKLTLYSM